MKPKLLIFLLTFIFTTFTVYAEDKVHTVIVLKDWKPYYSLDKNGKPQGYAIDLFEALAKDVGIKYEYKIFDSWSAMTPYRQNQDYIVPNTGIAKMRAGYTVFSNPTDTFQISYFKRKVSFDIKTKNDLKGKNIAVVKDNVCDKLVSAKGVYKVIYNDHFTALSSLLSGEVDAMCYPKPLLEEAIKTLQLSNQIVAFGKPLKEIKRGLGFSVQHSHDDLVPLFNQSLEKLKANRTYEKIYNKWFGEEEGIKLTYEEIVFLIATVIILFIVFIFLLYYWTRRKNWLLTKNELEKQVQEKTARFELALKASKAGIWEWNYKTNTLIWDHKMYEIYDIQAVKGESPYSMWSNAVDKDDYPKVEENLTNAVKTHGEYNISFWITTPNGERKYIQALGVNEYDENDTPIRMVGTNIDITEQKLKDIELQKEENFRKKNEKRLEKIVELNKKAPNLTEKELCNAALGIAVEITGSKIGYLHTFNEEQSEITLVAWNQEALKHCTAVHDEHYPLAQAGIWADAVRLKKVVTHNDYENIQNKKGLPEGHFKLTRHMSAPVIDNNIATMIIGVGNKEELYNEIDEQLLQATANDVEKLIFRKRTENKLLEQKEEFEVIFESTRDGIAIIDFDTNFLNCNEAFIQLSGYTKEEILSKSCSELVLKEDREKTQEAIEYTIENEHIENIEKRCVDKNGKVFTVNMSLSLMSDKKRILISVKDVSSLKLLEHQSKLASMGEMIGNIAHQWRQPLSIISTAATGMQMQKQMGGLEDKEFDQMCDMINSNAQYLSKTIDNFRDFIKGDISYVDTSVKKALEQTFELIEASLKMNYITPVMDMESDLMITGNVHELEQAFINIINNSKDALKERVEDEDDRFIFITTKKQNDNSLKVIIKDTAGGIDNKIIDRIFEPYFTTKHKSQGTGLGLAMVDQILRDRHKAEINVYNEEFEYNSKSYNGACFNIVFKK